MPVSGSSASIAADVERTKLEALRSSLQITDRILSERQNVALKFNISPAANEPSVHGADLNWAAKSLGNDIFINVNRVDKPQSPDGIATILGLNYHELAHVMLTPPNRQMIKDAYMPHGRTGALAKRTLHKMWDKAYGVLEDHRIETLLGAKYPSMQKYFAYAVLSQIVERTTPEELNLRHLLTHGRHHLPKKVRVTFKDFFEKEYGSQAAADFERVIDEYRFIPFATTVDNTRGARLVQEFAGLLEQYGITDPPSPSHSEDGHSDDGGTPDPGNNDLEKEQRKQMAKQAKDKEKKQQEEEEKQQTPEPQESSEDDETEDEESSAESDTEKEGDEYDDDFNDEDGDDESDSGESGDSESGDETDGDDSEEEGSEEEEPDSGDPDDTGDDSDGGEDREDGGDDDEADSGESGKSQRSGESDADTDEDNADAEGADEDDDDRTGKDTTSLAGNAGGSPDIIDKSDVKGALAEIMEAVLGDEETLADIQKYQGVMASLDGLASTLEQTPEKRADRFHPVTPEMFARSEQVAVKLREIWASMEPGWEYGVSDGPRLNMQNAMMAREPEDFDSIYDDWSPGQQHDSGLVVAILGDRSGSTCARYVPPNSESMSILELRNQPSLATVFSRNIWEAMYAFQQVEAKTTVLAFDHNCYTFYDQEERVDGNGWYALSPDGGTNPIYAIQEARRILLQSEQPNKLLIIFTDGEWWEGEEGSVAAMLASMEGVVKVAALAGGFTAESFEYKDSFDVVMNTAGDILPIMANAATRMLERSAQAR